jgi:Tannase and feruloyl esterase
MTFTRAEFDKLNRLSALYEPTDPDLSRFAAHGGKLVMWHGWADSGSAPLGSLNYFDAVRRTMGAAAAKETVALYLTPGVYHCSAGPTPARADYLSQLIAWREDAVPPGAVSVSFEASATDPTATKTITVEPHAPSNDESGDRTDWVGIDHYRPGRLAWCHWKAAAMVCDQGS